MVLSKRICGLYFFIILSIGLAESGFSHPFDKKRFSKHSCEDSYSVTCFKLDVVSYIEKFSNKTQFDIFPGVSVVRELNSTDPKTSEIVAELAKSFPNDADKRLDGFLLTKMSNFLQSHSIRVKLLDPQTVEDARSTVEGRKSKLKKGGLEAIIAAGMMMKGTLMALAIGGIAILAGKALMTGLMALMLSAIIGIRSLTGRATGLSYEIVTRPFVQQTHSHSLSHEDFNGHSAFAHTAHGSYSRSLDVKLPEHLEKPPTGVKS